MNCLNPTIVRNPSRYFNPVLDKSEVEVPCSKCSECREQQRQDWCVRSYAEWQQAKANNGFSLMVLLTYRESCVPKFGRVTNYKVDRKYWNKYCFDSRDVKRFIDSMRKEFKRKGLLLPTFLIACEYGPNGTKRPHLHAIINNYNNESVLDCVHFLRIIRKHWHYGRVSPGRSAFDLRVKNFTAIEYTTKYLTKDEDFYTATSALHEEIKKDLEEKISAFNKEWIGKDLPEGVKAPSMADYDYLKPTYPRRFTSYKFGECMVYDAIKNDKVYQYLHEGYKFEFGTKTYTLPRYVLNKLKYVYTPDGFTDNGNRRLKAEFSDLWIEYLHKHAINNAIDYGKRLQMKSTWIAFSHYYGTEIDWKQAYELVKERVTDWTELAIYKLYLRDREIPKVAMEMYSPYYRLRHQKEMSIEDLHMLVDWYVDECSKPKVKQQTYSDYVRRKNLGHDTLAIIRYNALPAFSGYDEVLDIIETIQKKSNVNKYTDVALKRRRQIHLSKFFNHV